MEYTLSAERSIRANLTFFFAYLFADLDDFLGAGAGAGAGAAHPRPQPVFDSEGFLNRRRAVRSGCLQEFLQEFLRSQMFERFCEQRRSKGRPRSGQVDLDFLLPL